jgi:hypothetical protein
MPDPNCTLRGCFHGPGFVIDCGYDLELGLASVGAGWADLVREAFAAKPKRVRVVQVKEKYAGLCIYAEPHSLRYQKVLDELETRSYTICEWCGAPGEVDERYHWLLTLCPACQEKRAQERPLTVTRAFAMLETIAEQAAHPERQN